MSDIEKLVEKAIKDVQYETIRKAIQDSMKKQGLIKELTEAVKKIFKEGE